jgi:hypothetical protein
LNRFLLRRFSLINLNVINKENGDLKDLLLRKKKALIRLMTSILKKKKNLFSYKFSLKNRDYLDFLEDLEEDPKIRENVNIYKG